jgi:hypothetical protein
MDRYELLKKKPQKEESKKRGKYRIIKIYNGSFKTTVYRVQKKFLWVWYTMSTGNDESSSYIEFKTPEEAEEFIKKGCKDPNGIDRQIIKHIEI